MVFEVEPNVEPMTKPFPHPDPAHEAIPKTFHKWGYPKSWMVYNGKSEHKMDDLGVPYFRKPLNTFKELIKS
jgi:hypothetical protein